MFLGKQLLWIKVTFILLLYFVLFFFQIAVSKRCDRQILNVRAKTKYRIRNKGTWNQQV